MKNPLLLLKIIAVVFGVIIIVLLGVLFFYNPAKAPEMSLASPDGALAIATSSLTSGALVEPPLHLEGTVTGGGWFFEAIFPIQVRDADGTVLGSSTAHATTDWTSTGTVPWTATVGFNAPHGATGTVVFMNDNPSGDPAHQKTFAVPVRFR